MKKNKTKKLSLKRETLKKLNTSLTTKQLKNVQGGAGCPVSGTSISHEPC